MADLPRHAGRGGPWYPPELARAVALLWLFAGLRADEIHRLRVGCVRWQREDVAAGDAAVLPKDAVCLLDVPAPRPTHAMHTSAQSQRSRRRARLTAVRSNAVGSNGRSSQASMSR